VSSSSPGLDVGFVQEQIDKSLDAEPASSRAGSASGVHRLGILFARTGGHGAFGGLCPEFGLAGLAVVWAGCDGAGPADVPGDTVAGVVAGVDIESPQPDPSPTRALTRVTARNF
jgi:hypothetical protein